MIFGCCKRNRNLRRTPFFPYGLGEKVQPRKNSSSMDWFFYRPNNILKTKSIFFLDSPFTAFGKCDLLSLKSRCHIIRTLKISSLNFFRRKPFLQFFLGFKTTHMEKGNSKRRIFFSSPCGFWKIFNRTKRTLDC